MLRPIVLMQLPALSGSVLVVSLHGESLLGRSTKCDLVIDHPSVSRRHALLSVETAGLRIADQRSRNGTFVDDIRVAGTVVASLGSRVRFGRVDFLTTGHKDRAEDLNSDLDTEKPSPPGQMRTEPAESEHLSEAQRRVYRLLVDGLPEKRIASRLGISICTVHNHIGAIYRAFRVHTRAELLVHVLSRKATV
jgi:DNA-binding CsgD family transcriptional regulator